MKVLGARLIGVFALSAAAAFASTNACPPSNGAGLPAASSGSIDNNISSGGFPGGAGADGTCGAIDLTFSNFSVINVANRAYVYQGGGIGGDPVASPIFLTYATERGTHDGSDTASNDGVNNFANKLNTLGVVGVGNITTATGGDKIDQVKVTLGNVTIHSVAGGTNTYELVGCVGVSISGNFTAANCTTAGGTAIDQTIDLNSVTSLTVAFTPTTVFSLNNRVSLTGTGGSDVPTSTSSFLTLTTEYDQVAQGTVQGVPEPATFAMLGSALVGLGFLRHRRRKT